MYITQLWDGAAVLLGFKGHFDAAGTSSCHRDADDCSRPTNLTEEGTNVLVDDLLGESYLYFDQKVV